MSTGPHETKSDSPWVSALLLLKGHDWTPNQNPSTTRKPHNNFSDGRNTKQASREWPGNGGVRLCSAPLCRQPRPWSGRILELTMSATTPDSSYPVPLIHASSVLRGEGQFNQQERMNKWYEYELQVWLRRVGGVVCKAWGRGEGWWGGKWVRGGLPAQVNEVVWECGPLPHSLYGVWSFALAWGDFFYPLKKNTPTGESVLARGCAWTCCRTRSGCRLKLRCLPCSAMVF